MKNQRSVDPEAAFWSGLLQPLWAASEDEDDRKAATTLIREREQFKGDLSSFMIGFHQMHDHLRANGVMRPAPETKQKPIVVTKTTKLSAPKPAPKPTPAPAPKLKLVKTQPQSQPADTSGGKRRPQLRLLHETVRGLLATYGIRADVTKRVDDEVYYYLTCDKVQVSKIPEIGKMLGECLNAFFGKQVTSSKLDISPNGAPTRAVVVLDPASPLSEGLVSKGEKVSPKKPKAVKEVTPDNGKGGEVKDIRKVGVAKHSPAHPMRSMHKVVREAIAPFGLEVDKSPRAPHRVDDTVNYYLVDDKEFNQVQMSDLNRALQKSLKEYARHACGVWGGKDQIFKIIVQLRPDFLKVVTQ